MLRLLKYIPVILPVVARFVKSPKGQKIIADIRRRIASKPNNGATGTRP